MERRHETGAKNSAAIDHSAVEDPRGRENPNGPFSIKGVFAVLCAVNALRAVACWLAVSAARVRGAFARRFALDDRHRNGEECAHRGTETREIGETGKTG